VNAKHLPKSLYTPEAAEFILGEIAKGRGLRRICRENMWLPDDTTVRWWIIDNIDGFAHRYEFARNQGLDAMAEELLDIADDGSNDYYEDPETGALKVDKEHVQRSRLRTDVRKWYLSKLAPKRYGDKQFVEHSVDESLAEQLRQARERTGR
jgi:hypothetical protein